MTALAGAALILAAVAFVALPFLGVEGPAEAADGGDQDRRALEAQKFEAYAAIKDAELDHQMGKLSDADFLIVREQYAGRALAALAALDSAGAGEGRRLQSGGRRATFCPQCGGKTTPGARYCGGCGRALAAVRA